MSEGIPGYSFVPARRINVDPSARWQTDGLSVTTRYVKSSRAVVVVASEHSDSRVDPSLSARQVVAPMGRLNAVKERAFQDASDSQIAARKGVVWDLVAAYCQVNGLALT